MSWVTVAWSALAACCLTLAAQHVLIGARQQRLQNFLFAANCISAAAVAGFELALMRASSAREYGDIMQASHVALFCLLVSLVLFVRVFFRAGRTWLAGAVIGVRSAVLLVNFLRTPNFNYASLSGIRRIPFLGESVSTADGVISAWGRLAEFGSLLLLAFLADAAVTVWRGGERRRAVIVGGSMILFVLFAAGHTALVHSRVLDSPYLVAFSYLPIVGAMGYELTSDVLRAARLARDLRASQVALVESDRRLALGAEAAGLGFWSWEVSRDEIWMSRTGRALRGFAPEEGLDLERFLSTVHPDDRGAVGSTLERAARHADAFEIEYRVVRPEGGLRWIVLRGAGERDPAGGGRVRGVSIDATARKSAETEAQRRQAELEHLSRVTVLGELAGSLAHEVNQPLTAIVSNAQAAQRFLARDGDDAGEVKEILTDIVQEGKHASDVIQRLRSLMRRDEVVFAPLVVGEVIEDVLRLCRIELASRGVAVESEVPAGLPPVRGDRVQIEQVLLNLVTNGCDAMGESDPSRRLLRLRAEIADGAVRVSVADRGSGIPPDVLERLFEPFVTTKERGIGLGLAVCRTIVDSHEGRLWAVNNEEGGATFHFTLPVFTEEAP
ncbi:MAG: sensor histidine kinase [Syntrophomonadaceae bacterium]